jgi:hypothetical protein
MKYTQLVGLAVVASLLFAACSESTSSNDAQVAQANVRPKSADSQSEQKSNADDKNSALFAKEDWDKVLLLRSLLRESQVVFEQVWAKIEPDTTGKKMSVLGDLRSRIDASFSESGQDLLKKEGAACNTEKHIVLKASTDPVSKVKSFSFFKHSCETNSDMSALAQVYMLGEDLFQIRFQNAAMPNSAGRMGSFLAYKTECAMQIKDGKYLGALSCKNMSQDTGAISHTLLDVMQLTVKGEVFVQGQKFENISDLKEKFEFKIALEGDGLYLYETFEDEVQEMAPAFQAVNEPGLESNPQQENKGEQNGQKENSNKEDSRKEDEQKSSEESQQENNEDGSQSDIQEESKGLDHDQLSAEEELQFTGA